MRDTIYHGSYVATVERQHDNDTVDLTPEDERVRGTGLSNVPIRHGMPGVRVRVQVGAKVMLEFASGDPKQPFATFWESGAIESLSFDGGDRPIARVGDIVTVFWPPSVPVVGTIGVLPFTGTMTITTPAVGIIDSGAPRVRA